jgi:hypothetical protein
LNLTYAEPPLSSLAFNFNLRRYSVVHWLEKDCTPGQQRNLADDLHWIRKEALEGGRVLQIMPATSSSKF